MNLDNLQHNIINRRMSIFTIFLFALFFVFIADSSMSFLFPILAENELGSKLTMGLVMSFSSVIGLICDFLFPQLFRGKSWKFYILSAIFLLPTFPVFTYLGVNLNSIFFFLLASGVWGIYFELIIFSIQKFIVSTQHREDFVSNWGSFHAFSNAAKMMGPLLGTIFLNLSLHNSPIFVIPIQAIAIVFVIFIAVIIKQKKHHASYGIEHPIRQIHLNEELKYWRILFPTILPLFIAAVMFVSVDAAYWTLGGLFGTELFTNGESSIEWLILMMYMMPSLIGSIIMSRVRMVNGKKKLMNIFLILSGFVLSTMIFFEDDKFALLMVIFVSTFLLSIAGALNEAVFTDLVKRLGKADIHLIGLNRVTSSLGYIIAPSLFGLLADRFSFVTTFSVLGFTSFVIGILLLIVTPRKLRIHAKEIKKMEEQESIKGNYSHV